MLLLWIPKLFCYVGKGGGEEGRRKEGTNTSVSYLTVPSPLDSIFVNHSTHRRLEDVTVEFDFSCLGSICFLLKLELIQFVHKCRRRLNLLKDSEAAKLAGSNKIAAQKSTNRRFHPDKLTFICIND